MSPRSIKKKENLSKGEINILFYRCHTFNVGLMYKPYTIQCLFTQFGIRQIFRVFLSKDTILNWWLRRWYRGCFDISITYRHSVHSAISFYIEKMLICSDDKRTVCFKTKYATLLHEFTITPQNRNFTADQGLE